MCLFSILIFTMPEKKYILNNIIAAKKLQRMAYEIAERNTEGTELILAGIKDNGYIIAQKIKLLLESIYIEKVSVIAVTLDKKNPKEIQIDGAYDINNKVLILVDDVANSGKTLTYVLKPFLEFYPEKIQTLVLVERTHKLFPITADYVGLSVATTLQEHIIVEVINGEISGAYLI